MQGVDNTLVNRLYIAVRELGRLEVVVGEGNGTPLQHSCLENPMDVGAWWAAVHGVAKSQTRLSDFTFTFQFCLLYCFVLSPLTLLGAVPHHHLTLSVKELTYSSN